MAQRPNAAGGSARRRTAPTKVTQPKPWGPIAIGLVLVLFLGGILAYAIANQGEGFKDPIDRIRGIDGVAEATDEEKKTAGHVPGPVRYGQKPPNTGQHNDLPQTCQVYGAPIADEHAVHSLEHGAVWITYSPDLPKDQVEELTELAQDGDYRLMSPYPGQKAKINASAWGFRLSVDRADDDRLREFVEATANGPQAPERGAACSGNNSTGPLAAAPVPPVQPSAPATPAPTASR